MKGILHVDHEFQVCNQVLRNQRVNSKRTVIQDDYFTIYLRLTDSQQLNFMTKPYPHMLCYYMYNHMPNTGLRQEIFKTMTLHLTMILVN